MNSLITLYIEDFRVNKRMAIIGANRVITTLGMT
jgi:hypothetical protein